MKHGVSQHRDLGRHSLQNCEKFLLLISHPVHDIYVIATSWTKITAPDVM
jgi:hypothetical protein